MRRPEGIGSRSADRGYRGSCGAGAPIRNRSGGEAAQAGGWGRHAAAGSGVDRAWPARTTRAKLTPDEVAALAASAVNWLRVGQPLRITGAPLNFDGGAERRVGRTGVIWRLCSTTFADHVYVNLDLIGAERSEKVVFLELRNLAPIEEGRRRPRRIPESFEL